MLRALSISLVLCGVLAAADPNLFFREDWADTEPALPVTQEHVANPEFVLADTKWRALDIESVVEKAWGAPDLSSVKSVGFTDLSIGGASSSSSRLDWIEVYGKPVK
jgi:hypothetical protein